MRYATKNYANPFFAKKKKKIFDLDLIRFNFSFKFKILFIGIFLLIISSVWFLFYSNFFVIKNFEISGTGRIGADTVKKIAERQKNNVLWIIFPQKNIFFFNENKLRASLEGEYSFESLNVIKDLPDTLKINYQEKAYALIWIEDEKYFYADKEGFIVTETAPLEITEKNYPLVYNQSQVKIKDDKVDVGSEYLDAILIIFELFREQEDMEIEKFIIDSEVDTVKVKIKEAGEIYFDINENLSTEYSKLIVLKNERLKQDFNKKIYIDLRNGDNIYYR